MNQMLASIRAGRDARHAASPALSLARSIGLELTKLKIRVPLQSSKCEGELQIDSKERMWLYVGVSDGSRATNFSNFGVFADTLKLDACEAGELPAWLARAQKKLKTRWNRNVKAAGVIRKKDGQRLVDWLFRALPE